VEVRWFRRVGKTAKTDCAHRPPPTARCLLPAASCAELHFNALPTLQDYDAWVNLVKTHHFVDNYEDAAAVGINAGMDQEGGFGTYSAVDAMPQAIKDGKVTNATVANAFRRLMRVRMRLGMFDPPASVAPMNAR
jgi:hypothetical protein